MVERLPDQRVPCSVFSDTSPGAYVGAYTHKDCTRRTVRVYLSDFSRVLLHPAPYVVASRDVPTSCILEAHRSRVLPPVPGPRPEQQIARTPILVYVLLYLARHMQPHLCRKSWA